MTIVRKDWTPEEIGKWYAEVLKDGAQVQYSSNGGITWLRFQRSQSNDLARLHSLVQRDHILRDVKQEKVKVTSEQAQVLNPTSSFMNSVAKAQAAATVSGSKHSDDNVNVFRTQGGSYWFSPVPLDEFRKTQPSAELVSIVTRTTYYDSMTANTNSVLVKGLHPGQVVPVPRQLGFVFRLVPAVQNRQIAHWWPVLTVANPNFKPDDWLSVKCARHYDQDLDQIFHNIGDTLAVVGGKWIWGWNKRYKMGDTWIVPYTAGDALIKRITGAGMAVEPIPPTPPAEHNPVSMVSHSAELTPEYVMGIRENLEELLRIGDKTQIIDSLFKVIEFRNKCVDELKELNKTIDKAREVIHG